MDAEIPLRGSADAPAWVPDERFDLAEHVVEAPLDAPVAAAELRGERLGSIAPPTAGAALPNSRACRGMK